MEAQNPLIPTPASSWKSAVNIDGVDLPLPSGNVARVRRLSPEAFLGSGMLPDPLSAIVSEAIHNKRGLPPSKIKKMASDPDAIQASLELFDRVLAFVTIMPEVQMPPKCTNCGEYYNVDDRHANQDSANFHHYTEGKRAPNVLYCDQVDLADKIFVFQFALMGTRDLETFRSQFQESLGHLSHM